VVGSPEAFAATRGARLGPAAQLVRAATVEGLVGFDAEGRVVPALADRWIVTEDGQSYIFRLRNGEWPDGSAITAEVAAAALKKALAGLRGTALALDLAPIEEQALAILRDGDRTNAKRSRLVQALSGKASADRYAAFLYMAPSLIAREARNLDGAARRRALDAYARARETSRIAPRLSLDPAATVFQLGTILASVAPAAGRG
jgi:hypothetical protein